MQLRAPEHLEPAAELDTELRRVAVMRVLEALPQRYAQALEAKYGDGLAVEDIARMLGMSPVAAQSLLARARAAFREHWRASARAAREDAPL